MENDQLKLKRVAPRYIVTNEDIFHALTPYEMAVYMALRYEADFSSQESEIKRSIAHIANKAKISERKVYDVLNALEFKHYLIQRHTNAFKSINSYVIAQQLNYFKPEEPKEEQNDDDLPRPAPNAERPAPHAGGSAPCAYIPLISSLSDSTTTTESKPEQEPETPTTTIQAPEIEEESKPSQEHVVVFESKGQDQFVLSKLKGTPKKHAPNCSQTRWLKEIKFHIDKHYPDNFNHGVCAVVKLLKFHAWTTPSGYVDLEEQEQIRLENERKHQAMLKAQEEVHNRKLAEMQRKPAHIEKTTHNIPKLGEIFDNIYKSLGKTRNTECFG